MAYIRILLDTNAYLRIGKSIKPLLGIPIGGQKKALYILKQSQDEFDKVSKLKSKFAWIQQEEYTKEKEKILTTTPGEKVEIERIWDYIWHYQKDEGYSLSPVDISCIATALILKIKLVTDDLEMKKTAKIFGVEVIDTIQLLKILVDEQKIDLAKVKEIVSYLKYIKDFPHFLNASYKAAFNENPPD